jgi:hypothetical protein
MDSTTRVRAESSGSSSSTVWMPARSLPYWKPGVAETTWNDTMRSGTKLK